MYIRLSEIITDVVLGLDVRLGGCEGADMLISIKFRAHRNCTGDSKFIIYGRRVYSVLGEPIVMTQYHCHVNYVVVHCARYFCCSY